MSYQDRDKVKYFLKKIEGKCLITKDDVIEMLVILLKDYWERGLE